MSHLPGFFDSFDNLGKIDASNLAVWLNPAPQVIRLENYLANRILYPQALPLTASDLQIDLAILREALRLKAGASPFLNVQLHKIIIPLNLTNFVPDLRALTWAFIDGLLTNRPK